MNKKEKTGKTVKDSKNKTTNKKKPSPKIIQDAAEYEQTLAPLMPELDELVKKNPNRLIGCGG